MEKYSNELFGRVYDNSDGSCFEVHEDRDGLGLIEIIYRDEDEVITQRLPTLTIEQAESFTKLILKVCNYLKKKEVGDL